MTPFSFIVFSNAFNVAFALCKAFFLWNCFFTTIPQTLISNKHFSFIHTVYYSIDVSVRHLKVAAFSFHTIHPRNAYQLPWQFVQFFSQFTSKQRWSLTTALKTPAKHVKRFIHTCSFNSLKTEKQPLPPSNTQIYDTGKKSIPTFQRLRIDPLQLQIHPDGSCIFHTFMMKSKLKTGNMFLDEEAVERFVKDSYSFCGYRFNSEWGVVSGIRRLDLEG